MILTIVDWLATAFIIIAAFCISSKESINPKVRITAFIFYLLGCTCLIILGSIVHTLGLIVQQIILCGFNIRGLINGVKEWKNSKKILIK